MRRARSTVQPPQQQLIQEPEPRPPGRCLTKPLGNPPASGAEQVGQIQGLPTDLGHRQTQQPVGAYGTITKITVMQLGSGRAQRRADVFRVPGTNFRTTYGVDQRHPQ